MAITQLEDSIAYLYLVFARYTRPERIECCPCGCTKPGATDALVGASLRELHAEDLLDYAFSAMTTQGTADDYRYLLPRLLEVIVRELIDVNPEIIFGKLDYAKWLTWPADEISALRSYFHALWRQALGRFPMETALRSFYEIEMLMGAIARTGESLATYLDEWTRTKSIEADEHLIQFVTMWGNTFANGMAFHEAFWKGLDSQAMEVRTWLLRAETLDRVARSAHLLKQDGFEHLFEPAIEILKVEARTNEQ